MYMIPADQMAAAKMSGASTDAESKFGDTDWSKENATVRSYWSAFVIKWVALAAEKGQTLIGLQPTPDKNLTGLFLCASQLLHCLLTNTRRGDLSSNLRAETNVNIYP